MGEPLILSGADGRAAILGAYRRPEPECLPPLIEAARVPADLAARVHDLAHALVVGLREKRHRGSGVDALMQEFSLSSQEGVALITSAVSPVERLYHRSDAVAQALQLLPKPWPRLGRALALIPRTLRELAYTLVARLRYRLFGRSETCILPPDEDQNRFLEP